MPQPRQSVSVAVIGGSVEQRAWIGAELTPFYGVAAFLDGDHAMQGLNGRSPSVLLVDEQTLPSGGIRTLERLRGLPALARVPVGYLTAGSPAALPDDENVVLLRKPLARDSVVEAVSRLVNCSVQEKWEKLPEAEKACLGNTTKLFARLSRGIEDGEAFSHAELAQDCQPLLAVVRQRRISSLLDAVKHHDNYTYVHSLRVATLLSMFGDAIDLTDDEVMILGCGGLLHDIGKMSIPHPVLNKPARLNQDELAVMRKHVSYSVAYLKRCQDLPRGIAIIAGQHHEKLDGTGYPYGLKGSQLNELARMAAIVDVFSALTDRRVYKPPMAAENALSIMIDGMASHLDRHLSRRFREVVLDWGLDTA